MKNLKIRLFAVIFIALFLNASAMGETTLIKTSTQVVMQSNVYEIIGNRTGQVIVKNKASGQVIRTFQMPEGVVRELFLLKGGKVLGASQKDRAIFWNLNTGETISQFPQRIYGFSHDETKFFTYHQGKIILYNYPKLNLACELENVATVGTEKFVFSPNDHFLAVLFATGRPESDEYYPGTGPLRRSIRYSKLFDINNCQEIPEFSKLRIFQLGKFSNNSQFYDIESYPLYVESESRYVTATWRFNLTTKKMQKLS
ncbi:hypothetical protein JYQ62_04450 [Nostoc sp. UHCC 0702]|nr:hypothetical protein JYQ62_04450 [Nostoc sp. UHCC 0702]